MASIDDIVKAIFEQYDTDKDGTLSNTELKNFYTELSGKRADLGLTADGFEAWFANLSTIDGVSDGTASPDELKNYLQSINYQG